MRCLACLTLCAGLLGFALGGSFVWSQQTVEHHQQRPTQAEGQHSASGGASADALAHKQSTKGHQEGQWYQTFLNHTPDWFVAIFTGLLAFITYRLVTTTGDLRASTDKLWEAGERQLDIATRAADHTEDAFRRLERPYLLPHFDVMTTHHLTVKFVPHGIPFMTFKMANFGKLPAILRSVSVGLINNPALPLRSTYAIEKKSYDVIPPGGITKEMRIEVTGGKVGEPFVGQAATLLILHGVVQYEDPTGAFHTDSFCMRGLTNAAGFTIEGGEEYNWTQTEYPAPRPHRVRGGPRE